MGGPLIRRGAPKIGGGTGETLRKDTEEHTYRVGSKKRGAPQRS